MRGWRALGLLALPAALAGAGATAQEGDPAAGRALAEAVCAECHAVAPNEGWMEDPPPLPFEAGVAIPFEDVANTPGVTPIALRVWLTSTHPTMPNLVLGREEIRDVVTYILSLRENGGI